MYELHVKPSKRNMGFLGSIKKRVVVAAENKQLNSFVSVWTTQCSSTASAQEKSHGSEQLQSLSSRSLVFELTTHGRTSQYFADSCSHAQLVNPELQECWYHCVELDVQIVCIAQLAWRRSTMSSVFTDLLTLCRNCRSSYTEADNYFFQIGFKC